MTETVKVNFKLPSGKQVPLNISPHDTLVEVRSFLSETTELYLHCNYQFTHKNTVLNEYIEFGSLNINPDITVQIT